MKWSATGAAIASELDGDAKQKAVCERVAEYFDLVPGQELKKWSKRIAEGAIVAILVDKVKDLLGS